MLYYVVKFVACFCYAHQLFLRGKEDISSAIKSFNNLLDALVESKNPKLAHDFYKGIGCINKPEKLQYCS